MTEFDNIIARLLDVQWGRDISAAGLAPAAESARIAGLGMDAKSAAVECPEPNAQ